MYVDVIESREVVMHSSRSICVLCIKGAVLHLVILFFKQSRYTRQENPNTPNLVAFAGFTWFHMVSGIRALPSGTRESDEELP